MSIEFIHIRDHTHMHSQNPYDMYLQNPYYNLYSQMHTSCIYRILITSCICTILITSSIHRCLITSYIHRFLIRNLYYELYSKNPYYESYSVMLTNCIIIYSCTILITSCIHRCPALCLSCKRSLTRDRWQQLSVRPS